MKQAIVNGTGNITVEDRPEPSGDINPGKVFDLTVDLDDIAEGYAAMDERRAIKALAKVSELA